MKNFKFLAVAMATAAVLTACDRNPVNPDPDIKSTVPEVAATEGAYTVVWNAVDYAECNDLVFAGNYNGYSTEVANMVKFEKIDGYTNWYKAVITPAEAIEQLEGKPCALASDGSFPTSWDHQWIGSEEKPCEVVKGEVEFQVEYSTETKMIVKEIGSVVYVRSYQFKVDPCVVEPEYDITFNLTVAQAMSDTDKVYVVGDFVENGWTVDAYEMTRTDATHFTATVKAKIGREYKYVANASWDYEMVVAAPAEGKDCSEKSGNLAIADVTMSDNIYGFNGITATICKEESQEGVMYIKCEAEGWTWKEMTKDAEKEIYTFSTTLQEGLSNVGANINNIADDTDAKWFPLETGELVAGDKVVYTYDATVEVPTLVIAKDAE